MNLKSIKQTLLICLLIFSVSVIVSCDKEEKKNKVNEKVIVAKLSTPEQRLYYSSTLAPISTVPVVTPVAGTVAQVFFSYGGKVKKGVNLFRLSSQQLAENYRKAVSDFLQKKQAFETGKLTFEGTKALYKAGVIPETQYNSESTQFNNNALNYLQARYQLEKVLRTAGIDPSAIEGLSISETDKVNALLQKHFHNIIVKAPIEGIALYPSSSNGSSAKPLTPGAAIKENELLLLIGDLTGLSAKFQVSEVDIDRIIKNMPVKISSSAFPNIKLTGYVSAVSSQATQNSDNSGLSMFSVSVDIPKLSEEAMKVIRVGMTAKFEIDIPLKKSIMLPVEAVFQKNGMPTVTIVDKNGVKKDVSVITGITTPTSVVISSGVNAGDQVVVHD